LAARRLILSGTVLIFAREADSCCCGINYEAVANELELVLRLEK